MSIEGPDGLTGVLMASEGFTDVTTILHGPGGCRFRYMRLAKELHGRPLEDNSDTDRPYYFGKPRIPCTFLDETDYINGGYDKISDALQVVSETTTGPISVICSPATALIGDNVNRAIKERGLENRAFTIDFNPVSTPMSAGFDNMIVSMMGALRITRKGVRKNTVNLLGISILSKDWEHSVFELKRILALMGLEVISVPGAGCSSKDLIDSAKAEFNITVYPEFCSQTAKYYEELFGIRYNKIVSAPIGTDAVSAWIKSVAELTGKDPSLALQDIAETQREFRRILYTDEISARKVTGKTFSVRGPPSVVLPITKWFYEYLSMVPVSVMTDDISNPEGYAELEEFLLEIGIHDVLGQDICDADYIVSSGDYVKMCKLSGKCIQSIDIGFPPSRDFIFGSKTILGSKGAANLMDCIFNV